MEINQSKGNLFSSESSSGDQWGEHVNDMFFFTHRGVQNKIK